jgi:four helix bundle protein
MASQFHDLVAYSQAVALADDLYDAIAKWPSFDRWSSGVQLMRAADSVGANIAEAAGRWHRADQRRFLLIARGSLYETEHWVARAETRRLLERGWTARLDEAARQLNGLIRKWGST